MKRVQAAVQGIVFGALVVIGAGLAGLAWRVFSFAAGIG